MGPPNVDSFGGEMRERKSLKEGEVGGWVMGREIENSWPGNPKFTCFACMQPKLKSAFSYEMGLLHLSVHSLQNLRAPSGPLPYIFKASCMHEWIWVCCCSINLASREKVSVP